MKQIFSILLLMICILLSAPVAAQISVSGTVRDSATNNAIANASVFATDAHDHTKILRYTLTNDQGAFHLNLGASDRGFAIHVTHIGYNPVYKIISRPHYQNRIEISFEMTASTTTLKEVEIKIQNPISVDGDTVNVNAKHFEKNTDRVIEQVIKRIPGVEIDEQGKIFINGKQVKTVTVENDDLFRGEYQIITKSLSNKAVEKIQIINNYLDDPIYKGIGQSDDIGINLILSDAINNLSPFGKSDAAGGMDGKYEGRINIIKFLPKSKFYAFLSGNNTGSDFGYEGSGNSNNDDHFWDHNPLVVESLQSFGERKMNDLPRRRNLAGNSHMGSIAWINRPNTQTKLQNSVMVSAQKNPFYFDSFRRYFDASSTDIQEGFRSAAYNYILKNQFTYEHSFNTHSKIVNHFTVIADIKDIQDHIRWNTFDNRLITSANAYNLANELSFLKKPSDHLLHILSARVLLKIYRSTSQLLPGNQQRFFDIDALQSIDQTYNIGSKLAGADWQMLYKTKGINIRTTTSVTMAGNQLNTNLTAVSYDSAADHWKRTNRMPITNSYASEKIKITGKVGNLTMSFTGGLNFIGFTNTTRRQEQLYFNTTNTIKWQPNQQNNLLLLYSISPQLADINRLLKNPVLTDYNKITYGFESPVLLNNFLYLMNYQIGNWTDAFLMSVTALFHQKNKSLTSNLKIYPEFLESKPVYGPGTNFANVTVSADRFLRPLSSNMKFKYTYNTSVNDYFINDIAYTFSSRLHGIHLSLRSAFDFPINFDMGAEYKVNKNRITGNQKTIRYTNLFGDVYFEFKNGFSGVINFEGLSTEAWNNATNSSLFLDVSVQKQMIENRISLYLNCSNLLNNKQRILANISPVEESTTKYRLEKRHILLGISFRF